MSPAEELYMGVGRELPAALLAFLLGGVLGGVYELFRTPRAASRHPAAAVFAEDIIFCLIFAVSYYSFSVQVTMGIMRLYSLVLMLLGFFAYLWTLGRAVSKIADTIIRGGRIAADFLGKMFKKATEHLYTMPLFDKSSKKAD